MIHGEFDIPNIEYFSNHNLFIGSLGTFQYKIEPKDDELHTYVWSGMLCFEKSEIEAQETFPCTAEGLEQALQWLETQKAATQ